MSVIRVGLISDTHGLLRPEALAYLEGADHIIHAGDVGGPDILARLAGLAPLTVVRGNNDTAAWTESIPETARLDLGGVGIHVLHDLKALAIDARAGGIRVVVAGHSHKPACIERDGVLYVNPGSAGRRRFTLPIAAGTLWIEDGHVRADLATLA